jgi:hypothetical protein
MPNIMVCMPLWRPNTLSLRCLYELMPPKDGRLDIIQPAHGYEDKESDGGRTNLMKKQEQVRQLLLASDYDYLLFVEDDMVVPQDTIQRLLDCDADVAYGLYVFRREPYLWSAYSVINEEQMVGYPLNAVPEAAAAAWGRVVDVDGVGFGCTLIKRRVLEQIAFRVGWDEPHPGGEVSHSDFYFAVDCLRADFTQRCNTSLLCGHIHPLNEKGKYDPSIILPSLPSKGNDKYYRFVPFPDDDHLAQGSPVLERYARYYAARNTDMWQHMPLLRRLARGNVVELGTRYGVSTSALLAGVEAQGGHVWSVDTEDCSHLFDGHPLWTFRQQDSTCMDDMPNRVDVLFVDTIHTYEQVTKELTLWYSRLAPGAVVLGHDTEDVKGEPTEVKQAFVDFGNKMDVQRLEFHRGCFGMAVMHLGG